MLHLKKTQDTPRDNKDRIGNTSLQDSRSIILRRFRKRHAKIWIDHSSLSQHVYVAGQPYVTKKGMNIQYLKEIPGYNINKTIML